MTQPTRKGDIRKTDTGAGPRTGSGGGAAYGKGYGQGGLGAGAEIRPPAWDAPGVTPAGQRTGSPADGPRIPMDEESDPDAGRFAAEDDA